MDTPTIESTVQTHEKDDNDHSLLCPGCVRHQTLDVTPTLKRRRNHDPNDRANNHGAPVLAAHPTLARGASAHETVVGTPLHKRARVDRTVGPTFIHTVNSASLAQPQPSDVVPRSATVDSTPFALLPAETVRAIVGFLGDRDYYACMLASSLFHVCNHQDVLLRRYATRDIFDSNETLADIEFVCARYGREPELAVIVKAASRGRRDIVMHVVHSLGPRASIPSWNAPKSTDSALPSLLDVRTCVKDALCAALDGGHMLVISALAARYGFNETVAATGLMSRAARMGRLDVVKAFHNAVVGCAQRRREGDTKAGRPPRPFDPHIACRHRLAYNGSIQELTSVGTAAWHGGHTHVLDWLIDTQCPGACVPDRHYLDDAVSRGRVALARWAASRMGQRAVVGRRAVDEAASRGHVDTVRWAHESNLRRCSVSTIEMAARSGRVDVIRWAAGDAGRPAAVPEWRDARVATLAACEGNVNIIQWLYEHHRECVTPEAARHAARAGHTAVVRFLHEKGVAPVTCVSLLGRAVKSRKVDLVDAVAAAGAPYKPGALVFAIRYKLNDIVGVLCRRYIGVIDPVEAMRAAGREAAYKIARAIMTDLPGACIERARESIPVGRSAKALGKCVCYACKPTAKRVPAPERQPRTLAALPSGP
nr:Ankyrin repeat domain containing protein [Pandoravirus aubagnensis]